MALKILVTLVIMCSALSIVSLISMIDVTLNKLLPTTTTPHSDTTISIAINLDNQSKTTQIKSQRSSQSPPSNMDHNVNLSFHTLENSQLDWIPLDSSKFIYLNPGRRYIGYYLQSWRGVQGPGFGNILSQYWFSIAYAYFHKLNWIFINANLQNIAKMRSLGFDDFDVNISNSTSSSTYNNDIDIVKQNKYVMGMFDKHHSGLWTKYIPTEMNLTNTYKSPYCTICNAIDLSMFYHYIHDKHYYELPFWFDGIFMVFNYQFINNFYVPTVEKSMREYTKEIFMFDDSTTRTTIKDDYPDKITDFRQLQKIINYDKAVIIHLRCGDILAQRDELYEFGFFGLSYIYDMLKQWGIYNQIRDGIGGYKIYIIVNLNTKDSRKAHLHETTDGTNFDYLLGDKCERLVNNIVNNGLKKEFKSQVIIIGDGTMSSDQYHISHGKYVICGFSTFCWYAAFGNPNNISMIVSGATNYNKFKDIIPNRFSVFHTWEIGYIYMWKFWKDNQGFDVFIDSEDTNMYIDQLAKLIIDN